MIATFAFFNIASSYFVLEIFEQKKEIIKKIKQKIVTKEDLKNPYRLAKTASVPNVFLSIEEKDLILTLRENKIPATEAKKIILEKISNN